MPTIRAFPRTGLFNRHRSEAHVWPGIPRAPRAPLHGHAGRLWWQHDARSDSRWLQPHDESDGPSRRLPWHGRYGGHGQPPCKHDETTYDGHQASATAAAAETARPAGEQIIFNLPIANYSSEFSGKINQLSSSFLIWQFMNQTRQGMKMENAPGGNPAMRPGMQPGMQPAGMGGQVRSQYILTSYTRCVLSHFSSNHRLKD